jgi:hypothetical protein
LRLLKLHHLPTGFCALVLLPVLFCHHQAVRRDPAERAALQARLAEYEAQEAPLREAREALLAANKQQVGSLTAEAKLAALQERRAKEEERLLLVGAAARERRRRTRRRIGLFGSVFG